MRILALLLFFPLFSFAHLSAQDTTQAYPWRLSYFPYPLASPNDGLMGVARAVWFRQSRWDDRVSVADQVAIDAGYSTKDAWLVRARGDFPRLAPGWRLEADAQLRSTPFFATSEIFHDDAAEQRASVEVTRTLSGPLMLAARGGVAHVRLRYYVPGQTVEWGPDFQTDWHGRLAAVLDLRDREYDPHRGALLQAGVLAGSYTENFSGGSTSGTGYHGWYGLAAGWLPLGSATVITARFGARSLSSGASDGVEAQRILPAWEDDQVVFGGPESNRGLPESGVTGRGTLLASAELRRKVLDAPGAAVSVIGFVDAGRAFVNGSCVHPDGSGPVVQSSTDPSCVAAGDLRFTFDGWTVAPGLGLSLRLLRAAAFTITAAHAEDHVRIYAYTGWSW